MAKCNEFVLVQDKKGMLWDLALYVPTVIALLSIGSQLWYGGNQNMAYLLIFLATFFFLIGFNRIAGTRLMILPSAAIVLKVSKQGISLSLRSGIQVDLVKKVRFYADYAGKSFGLSGMDASGKARQYVFHRGQFLKHEDFKNALTCLDVFK